MKQMPTDVAAQLQELTSRSLRQHVRNNQRFADLLKRVSAGELSMQQVRDELRQFSEHETAEYLRTITSMGVSFFSGLLELNQSLNERFFHRLEQPNNGAEEPTPKSRGQLTLRGALGTTVRGRFVVENRREQESDVAMSISPLIGRVGIAFQAPFVIEPSRLRLGAGEEQAVQISLRLHPELFGHGEQYSCQLAVHGRDDTVLDIRIEVEEKRAATPAVVEGATVVVEERVTVAEAKAPAASPRPAKNAARRPRRLKETAGKTRKSIAARKRAPKKKPSA